MQASAYRRCAKDAVFYDGKERETLMCICVVTNEIGEVTLLRLFLAFFFFFDFTKKNLSHIHMVLERQKVYMEWKEGLGASSSTIYIVLH